MFTEESTIHEVVSTLASSGCKIVGLTFNEGRYGVTVEIDLAHVPEGCSTRRCVGGGREMHDALNDAMASVRELPARWAREREEG